MGEEKHQRRETSSNRDGNSQSGGANQQGIKYSLKEKDSKYIQAVKDGDIETAQRMVDEAAKAAGYTDNSEYQGSLAFNGSAPSENGYFTTKSERKKAFENGDFEGDYSLGDYIDNGVDNNDLEWNLTDRRAKTNASEGQTESIDNLRKVVNSGSRTIKIYRAVDTSIEENSIRNGDWVTPSKKYA